MNSSPRSSSPAFTLLELLVVVAILALLAGMLLPAMGDTRRKARELQCLSQLRSIQAAVLMYAGANDDCVVPSYNMKGLASSRANPLDGWAPLLDQGRWLTGSATMSANPFVCPMTENVAGLAVVNRGASADKPMGYMDWPAIVTLSSVSAITMPTRGLNKIVRTSYWINAENPIGSPKRIDPGIHFSASVGYGPDPDGLTMPPNRMHQVKHPARLIAFADGIFAGNQHAVRRGETGLRIGYRHGKADDMVNAAFADGHVEPIAAVEFPRKDHPSLSGAQRNELIRQNLGTGPTIYANPEKRLSPTP